MSLSRVEFELQVATTIYDPRSISSFVLVSLPLHLLEKWVSLERDSSQYEDSRLSSTLGAVAGE